jgi:hypothetical protein
MQSSLATYGTPQRISLISIRGNYRFVFLVTFLTRTCHYVTVHGHICYDVLWDVGDQRTLLTCKVLNPSFYTT